VNKLVLAISLMWTPGVSIP